MLASSLRERGPKRPPTLSDVASKRLAPGLGRFGYVGHTRFHIFWDRVHRQCAKPGHWVVRLFSKTCLAPLPFSLLLCVYIATVLSVLGLKPYDHISALSFWSAFNLDQWSLFKVILGRMMSRVFFSKKLLIETNSNNANGLIVFNLPKSKIDMLFDHLRSPLHLKFTCPKFILWP